MLPRCSRVTGNPETAPLPKLPRFPLRRHFFTEDILALERGNQWPSPASALGSRAIVSPSGIRRSWHSQAADYKFRRSVNPHALPNSPGGSSFVTILYGQPRRMAAPKGAPVSPPSTISSTALMYDESSEARKSTALATSSVSPLLRRVSISAGVRVQRSGNRNQESQNSHLTLTGQCTTIWLWIDWVQHSRLCPIRRGGQ
jgi:hypothetical protein